MLCNTLDISLLVIFIGCLFGVRRGIGNLQSCREWNGLMEQHSILKPPCSTINVFLIEALCGSSCPFLVKHLTSCIPAIGGVLFVFVIISLLQTSFTDPGILPRATPEEAADIEKQIGEGAHISSTRLRITSALHSALYMLYTAYSYHLQKQIGLLCIFNLGLAKCLLTVDYIMS